MHAINKPYPDPRIVHGICPAGDSAVSLAKSYLDSFSKIKMDSNLRTAILPKMILRATSTKLAFVLACIFASQPLTLRAQDCTGQVIVFVGDLRGNPGVDVRIGTETLITCQYEAVPGHIIDNFEGIQWRKGDTDPASDAIGFINPAGTVTYESPFDAPAYVITSTDLDKGSNLTIQNVSQADRGTYRCHVYVRDPTTRFCPGSAPLLVNAVVKGESLLLDEDGKSWNNNETVTLDPKEGNYSFTCKVPGIYPGIASFKWTVGGDVLTGVHLPDEVDGAGLRNSSSIVTLTSPLTAYDKKRLQCEAMDEDGNVDASIGVILDITSPGGAGSILYRLDVILACLALTAVYMFNHGI